MDQLITKTYLTEHPDHIFVFGDNALREGHGGAAALRDSTNTYGFITKKAPSDDDSAYYKPEEYEPIFYKEIIKLRTYMLKNSDLTFLISKVGAGLANKYNIWENIIEPKIKRLLSDIPNIIFLWE